MAKNFNTKKIQLDIANWALREFYELPKDIEIKINNRLIRKYKLKVDSKELSGRIKYYREIYSFAKKNLSKFILPSKGGFAEPKYVKYEEITRFLSDKFPYEDQRILDIIIAWVVYHEYLR